MRKTLLIPLLLTTLIGCGDSASNPTPQSADLDAEVDPTDLGGGGDEDVREPDLPTTPAQCDAIAQIEVMRTVRWPGGGQGIRLLLTDASQAPIEDDPTACLEVNGVEAEVAPINVAPGALAILMVPGTDGPANEARLEALRAFVATRGKRERVGLWTWTDAVRQVSTFTRDKEQITDALGRVTPGSSATMTPLEARRAVKAELDRVGGAFFGGARRLLVIGAPDTPGVISGGEMWVVAGDAPGAERFQVVAETPDALEEVSARLDTLERRGLLSVGVCPQSPVDQLSIGIKGGAAQALVELEPSLESERGASCDPVAAAMDARPLLPRIDFIFNDAQRAVFDDYVDARNQDDFELSIRLNTDASATPAAAHLRGQSSLDCDRKSFTIDLDGNQERPLFEGVGNDEFYLLSMCLDDRYFQQYLADSLMYDLDLFELSKRYIELFIDGQTQGVYLLLDKTKEALLRDHSGMRTIFRRRFDPEDKPADFHFSHTTEADARAEYDGLTQALEEVEGVERLERARSMMHLDQYLRMVAFHTLTGNGDYVDEAWLYSTHTLTADGTGTRAFTNVMAWDPDDLYVDCHHRSRFAIPDETGLLFCAEGDLDWILLTDDVVFGYYVELLEAMIETQVTLEVFDRALEATRDALLPFFDDPDVCAAMVKLLESNPGAIEPAEAKRDISAAMDDLRRSYIDKRADLLTRIEDYRR